MFTCILQVSVGDEEKGSGRRGSHNVSIMFLMCLGTVYFLLASINRCLQQTVTARWDGFRTHITCKATQNELAENVLVPTGAEL